MEFLVDDFGAKEETVLMMAVMEVQWRRSRPDEEGFPEYIRPSCEYTGITLYKSRNEVLISSVEDRFQWEHNFASIFYVNIVTGEYHRNPSE
jgi:hypothetical protein